MFDKKRVKSTVKPVSVSLLTLSIMSVNSLLISGLANAEESALEASQTMVITGEKFTRDIKDTITAVTVLREENLEAGEAKNAKELATRAPNVNTDSFGNFAIRGMSGGGAATGGAAFITGSRARVATVIDGSTQDWSGYNFTPSSLWDVDQVEILRGPQSTTQGSSAIAGAVVINTNDPSFETEAAVRVGLDSYKNGNTRYNLAGMLSGPIIDDELAYRLALDTSNGEGWLNYESGNYKVPNLSDAESLNFRGKLLWEPSSHPELSAKLTINHRKNEGEHASFANNTDKGIDTQTMDISSAIARVQDSKEGAIALDVDYELSDGISNSLHISHIDSDLYADGYQTNKVFNYEVKQNSSSIENRMIFNQQGSKLKGVFGVFLAKKKSSIYANQNFIIDTGYTTKTSAVYGESNYAFTPKTSVSLGLRVENEDVDKTGSFLASGQLQQNADNTYLLPKVGVTHAISENTTLGATLRKGYSPSGSGITFGGDIYTYDSEEVTTLEFSSKSHFANNTTLNANIFYNKYDNYQALSGISVVNVDKAHTYGLELEASTWANSDLQLWGSVGLLQTKFDKNDTNEGNELSSAPKSNISIGFNQLLGSHWSLGADATYVGKYHSELANTTSVGDHAISNARIQYTKGDLTINGYVKNLTDEDAVYYRAGALSTVGQTRTVGISAVYRM